MFLDLFNCVNCYFLSKLSLNQNKNYRNAWIICLLCEFCCQNERFVESKQQQGDFITVTGSEKIFGCPSDQSETIL